MPVNESIIDMPETPGNTPAENFASLYHCVREAEHRILTDEQVALLPEIERSHACYQEWRLRKRSANRLKYYLQQKYRHFSILEIGCGNGWLSAMLAGMPDTEVTAMDVNAPDVEQARRVFKKENLEFICENFTPGVLEDNKFDVIVFAASIQYFKSLTAVLNDALSCLAPRGEIHIIDTHFYRPGEVVAAAYRTQNYYTAMGFPEMAGHYFQHCLDNLAPFNYKVLSNPNGLFNRIFTKTPFYWAVIGH